MARQEREPWYYGRDSRAVTVERLRRWTEIAVKEGLSTDMLDQLAYRCALYLDGQEWRGGERSVKWTGKWRAEVDGNGLQEQGMAIGSGPRNGRT